MSGLRFSNAFIFLALSSVISCVENPSAINSEQSPGGAVNNPSGDNPLRSFVQATTRDSLSFSYNAGPTSIDSIINNNKAFLERHFPSSNPGVTDTSISNFSISSIFCGIKSNGSLWCAGKPGVQVYVGNGSTRTNGNFYEIFSSGVTQVATNGDLSCAIKSSALYCWGMSRNNRSEPSHWLSPVPHLGNGTNSYSTRPIEIISSGVQKVVLGFSRSCAILSGGELRCWGEKNGTTPQTIIGHGVSEVYLGPFVFNRMRSCARVSGALKCWEDKTSSRELKTILSASELEGVESISVGLVRICYVKNEALLCNRDEAQNQEYVSNGINVNGHTTRFMFRDIPNYDFQVAHMYGSGVASVSAHGTRVLVVHTNGSLSETGFFDGIKAWKFAGTNVLANAASFKQVKNNSKLTGLKKTITTHTSGMMNTIVPCMEKINGDIICQTNHILKFDGSEIDALDFVEFTF